MCILLVSSIVAGLDSCSVRVLGCASQLIERAESMQPAPIHIDDEVLLSDATPLSV